MKALNYTHQNYLEQPTLDDPSVLIHSNIFPHRFIPQIEDIKKTYLTVSCRKIKKIKNTFKTGYLYIEVFTEKGLFKTEYGVTRVDFIINKIDELFNSQRGIGIGELEFVEMDEIIINNQYMGAYISYKPIAFN